MYVVDTATLRELLLSKIFVEDESAEYEKSLEENGRSYLNYVEELAQEEGREVEKVLRTRRHLHGDRRGGGGQRAPTSSSWAASRRRGASATR